ncbi:hypothetical protein DEO72_LG6g862 [Vigna unguiculata]|uniref:Uncharacterized protein n=1 Tax=Vigna unguiculata TaxID=3917 RepID=A0A4D6M4B3_VIGUN|nr:hypothetical protein DEO72_LG6g861 [Vigna unguiculata]QCD96160.1 hypothetical protein DEO72_LG6g862 [Vigna unguiculata]
MPRAGRTTSGEVHRGRTTSGKVRVSIIFPSPRLTICVIEGYNALGLSSPFLFVYGDDRVIHYTGADVTTGDAEDAQAME